jgi:hypothetical protein
MAVSHALVGAALRPVPVEAQLMRGEEMEAIVKG